MFIYYLCTGCPKKIYPSFHIFSEFSCRKLGSPNFLKILPEVPLGLRGLRLKGFLIWVPRMAAIIITVTLSCSENWRFRGFLVRFHGFSCFFINFKFSGGLLIFDETNEMHRKDQVFVRPLRWTKVFYQP